MLLSNYHPSDPPPHHQHHNWNHNQSLWLLSPLSPPPGEQRSILFPGDAHGWPDQAILLAFPLALDRWKTQTALCMCSTSHYHEYVVQTIDLHIPYPARITFKKAWPLPPTIFRWHQVISNFLGGECLQIPHSAMIVAGRVDEAKLGPPFCRNCRNLHLNVHVSDIQPMATATQTWRPWYPQPEWCWKPMLLFVFISLFDIPINELGRA